MRLVAFVGPSLPASRRTRFSAVEWRSPAARGDLDTLDLGAGDVVLLIDGIMVTGHPPSPRECARLMERGVRLYGSSSLGALRAVELRELGMRGSGWVYQQVLARAITHDDELVAVLDARTHRANTLFLVNVRFGLGVAVHEGRMTANIAGAIIATMRGMHFSKRTRAAVERTFVEAGVDPATAREVLSPRYDVKRRDATRLLSRVTRQWPP